MALLIVIVLIAIIAFAMYDNISPKLPKELQLKDGGAVVSQQGGIDHNAELVQRNRAFVRPTSSAHWTVSSDGVNSRLVREFDNS